MSLSTPLLVKASGSAPQGQAWVTKPMLVTLVLLASFPLWCEHVGLSNLEVGRRGIEGGRGREHDARLA